MSSYTIVPAADDAPACILDLWERNLSPASQDRYCWLYEQGPAISLLLQSASGTPVGSTGIMLRTFRIFGQTVQGAQAVDLNVDREHRTVGPAASLQRAVIGEVKAGRLGLIYGFPNPQSEAVSRRVGYKILGDLQRWVKPLSLRPLLAKSKWTRGVAGIGSATLDPVWRLVSPETWARRSRGLRVERVNRFDGRFDRLWETAAARFPIVGERTAEYLNWRFAQCPDEPHETLGVFDEQQQLVAYLVYRRRDRRVFISDFLFAEARHFDALLMEFLRRMRRDHMEAVEMLYWGSDYVGERFRRFGFHRRPLQWKVIAYADGSSASIDSDQLFDRNHWHITRADFDTND